MKIDIALKKEIDNSYEVHIGTLPNLKIDAKVAIVTNPKISGLHLHYLLSRLSAKEIYIITVEDGESYKTLASLEKIVNNLFEHKLNRSSVLIALGGGVVGDMTGFAASMYQRGIDFIQIPTTLLAQVDASVGGKTGVNNAYGKNLLGAFHQPRAVYIDPHFLSTLPKREYSAGIAEVIKMAVCFDKDFFEWLEKADLNNPEHIKTAIAKSVKTKAHVVSQDEKEKGIRAALNYGHTFGHVIENETKYTRYLHGESVAIGMMMANELASRLGMMKTDELMRIKKLLLKYDLPVAYDIVDIEAFYQAFFLDKKSLDSKITFIVPSHIGGVELRSDIQKDIVMDVLGTYSGQIRG
ncbi:3-dehydroquinate synthase [Sulfurimonas sp. MAG313]|nr:3-dehydroquinate synthase [Sulfurimonas sp. MAG313]MDF1881408.1 3-dehydroquinate synthase [Sulfurimonas sp. MAG313]